jgi:predicted metal-dependent phosphoesterase TrpH
VQRNPRALLQSDILAAAPAGWEIFMRADLHTHTLASDGELSPAELLALQAGEGTRLTAITDHDTLAGYDEAVTLPAADPQLRLVSGIEFSAAWRGREVHVVGLGFDAQHAAIRAAVAAQAQRRRTRAQAIGERLERLGVSGALQGAEEQACGAPPGRPHFARFLVASMRVRDEAEAFVRYLGEGRPAACAVPWAPMEEAIGWVRSAGGLAVLAHPLAYGYTRARMRALLDAFREAGGAAAEVALAGIAPAAMHGLARQVRDAGLRASAGSDYHAAAQHWRRPSRIPPLPEYLDPVWSEWS